MSREEILRKHEDISKGHLNGWQKEWVLKAMQEYSDQQNTLLQEQFEDLKRQNLELQEKLAEKEKELSEVKLNIKYAIESINDFQDGGCSKNIKDAKYFLNLTPPSKR